jgi:Phage protein (N4 Gp49/phage Sf6 gene 66) family
MSILDDLRCPRCGLMTTEAAIQDKTHVCYGLYQPAGTDAPRVTLADIEAIIAYEYYITADKLLLAHCTPVIGPAYGAAPLLSNALFLLTLCVLILKNGYTVVGEAACVSAENFNEAKGRKIAREKAIEKLWPLLGYQLKERQYIETTEHTFGPSRSKEGY